MQEFNLEAEDDNSYIKSRSKSETTVTPILLDELKKNDEMIANDIGRTKQQKNDLKGKSLGQTKCIGLWKEPDFWKFGLMEGCDSSYEIIGEIHTTETHWLENN
jgi:hypothetical protein